MIRKISIVAFLFSCVFLKAQQVSPIVVNTSGKTFQNAQMGLSFNVGEVAVTKISNSGNTITQGFLQPFVNPISIKESKATNDFIVFPNPSKDVVTIRSINNKESKLKVRIIDALGRVMLDEEVEDNTVSLQEYPNGVYQMTISDDKNNVSHKTITKIN